MSRIFKQLASEYTAVYPTVGVQQIVKQLQMYHDKYENIMHSYKSRSENAHFKQKLRAFLDELNRLFDFSSRKCVQFANCDCAKENQVPQIDKSFLSDQKGPRRTFIGSIIGEKRLKFKKKEGEKSIQQLKLYKKTQIHPHFN